MEFRTKGKGKDRVVYPISKKPYGVPRELALEEVEALRKRGLRARLIETNRRLDLYAAYEAVTQADRMEERTAAGPETEKEGEEKEPAGELIPKGGLDALIENLGGLGERKWEEVQVRSHDRKTWIGRVDADHVVAIFEEVEGSTNYETPGGLDFSKISIRRETGRTGLIDLSPEQQKQILSEMRDLKGTAVDLVFYAPENSSKAYIGLFAAQAGTNGIMVGEPIELMNKYHTHDEVIDRIHVSYAQEALKSMRSINAKITGRRDGWVSVEFSPDTPVEFSAGNARVKLRALVAPRQDADMVTDSGIRRAFEEVK
ncbi:hypothetical protein [Caldiplasma sukawensis]